MSQIFYIKSVDEKVFGGVDCAKNPENTRFKTPLIINTSVIRQMS